jgi:hypothetical protein
MNLKLDTAIAKIVHRYLLMAWCKTMVFDLHTGSRDAGEYLSGNRVFGGSVALPSAALSLLAAEPRCAPGKRNAANSGGWCKSSSADCRTQS